MSNENRFGEPWSRHPLASRTFCRRNGRTFEVIADDDTIDRIVSAVNYTAGCTLPEDCTLAEVLDALKEFMCKSEFCTCKHCRLVRDLLRKHGREV